jgi:hypothetical protein
MAQSEDSVKIEELLGWSVTEKSPFSEISDKGEATPTPAAPESDEIIVVKPPLEEERAPSIPMEEPAITASIQDELLPNDDALMFEVPSEGSGVEPPIELASAAEMIPGTEASSFGVSPISVDGSGDEPVELVSPAEMTPQSPPFEAEESSAKKSARESESSPQAIQGMSEKMIKELVERIAKEVIEKVTWEVVPSLAEIAIQKEIEKLRVSD